ncbi:glycosyltransferase family 2 protein [Nodularia spumigena]|uniref:glycosyltransferase family 2 protein n=1 Tax=Nodularia spumigena TaxID=70799 RepID=UPI002B21E074|nr:glycosyltransferase family 2 protein [Nodularia spumigena]MEA5557735.1 glycosyltransferase family 2 protein [Nodularia spumigena CH309]
MKTPVVFCIFRRLDTTEKVFQAIRQAQPSQLLVIADGPRVDCPGEVEECAATRAIIDQVDWDCEVIKNYSDINLGCHERMISGLDWAFSHVEQAIILEDDCLPDASFFPYCEEVLELYRDEDQVMHINGFNSRPRPKMLESYYISQVVSCWGWATWRRAWQHYDVKMQQWESYQQRVENAGELEYFGECGENIYAAFEFAATGEISYWDVRWGFSCAARKGLSVVPKTNLIKNLGFRADATHTQQQDSPIDLIPIEGLDLPLIKPDSLMPNRKYDQEFVEFFYKENDIFGD